MYRPPSIVTFERLYLASIALGLLNTVVGWNARQALLANNPAVVANPQMLPVLGPIMAAMAIMGALLALILWYFVARRGSVVAKWIVTVLAGLGGLTALGTLMTLVQGHSPSVLSSLLGLVNAGLSIAAAAMLFRADALPWFGEVNEEDFDEVVE